MNTVITDNTELHRYEIHIDGKLAGIEDYTLQPGVIALEHTERFPEFAGTDVAKQLVGWVLDDAHRRGLAVLPHCEYVAEYIRRHADRFLDLVPAQRRAEFELPA